MMFGLIVNHKPDNVKRILTIKTDRHGYAAVLNETRFEFDSQAGGWQGAPGWAEG